MALPRQRELGGCNHAIRAVDLLSKEEAHRSKPGRSLGPSQKISDGVVSGTDCRPGCEHRGSSGKETLGDCGKFTVEDLAGNLFYFYLD